MTTRSLICTMLLVAGITISTLAQNGPAGFLKFDEITYDFGQITEGEQVSHTFTFTNVSADPITISEARAGCGCTVPVWSKEPILPGQQSSVKVTFNSSGKQGIQNKEVVINTNVGEYKVFINCIVNKAPESKPAGSGKGN